METTLLAVLDDGDEHCELLWRIYSNGEAYRVRTIVGLVRMDYRGPPWTHRVEVFHGGSLEWRTLYQKSERAVEGDAVRAWLTEGVRHCLHIAGAILFGHEVPDLETPAWLAPEQR